VAELTLILTNLPDRSLGARADGAVRLAALELLFARAQREPLTAGWRGWLASRIAVPAQCAPAEIATLAFHDRLLTPDVVPARAHHWFATPLHFFAGIDSVHLHPQGVLQLGDDEQQRLAQEFARVFAGSSWSLSAVGQRELLLSGPPLQASADDPLRLLTRTPDACMARGPDANVLRRLGSEIELWLHEHPLNLERVRRGELPVTGLWLWGAALPAELEPGSAVHTAAACLDWPSARKELLPVVYGRDIYTEACWRLRSQATHPLPHSWQAEPALARSHADRIVLLALHLELGLATALLELERLWLAPVIAALQKRRITTLYCVLADRASRLTWHHCIRVWRARAPWWEELR
jgi:hypothetical protein